MFTNTLLRTYNFFFNYPTPSNLTTVWNFGVLGFILLTTQIISGLVLSFYYVPHLDHSFEWIEWIMRDTYTGYMARYIHSNGASIFFFCIYIHFFRSLYYFSYLRPKMLVWNIGVILFLLMIIAAFTGYVLPWGQMSFWAATVITSLVTVLPAGGEIAYYIWGSYGVSGVTLNRFYTAHFLIPFLILFLTAAHFMYLHQIGSNNNLFIENTGDKSTFHPFYTWKDLLVILFMISVYFFIISFVPNHLAHSDNYIKANPLVTPTHIVPEWYFLAYYAILRSVPHKLAGVILMFGSIIILLFFPYLIKHFYRSAIWSNQRLDIYTPKYRYQMMVIGRRFNPFTHTILFWIFFVNFIALSYLGMKPVEFPYENVGLYLTFNYFGFFFFSFYHHSFLYWMQYWEMNDSKYTGIKDSIIATYQSISNIYNNYKKGVYKDYNYVSRNIKKTVVEEVKKERIKVKSGYINAAAGLNI